MEITTHDLLTVLHGMGFGALFMLAFSGAFAELYRISIPGAPSQMSTRERTLLGFYLAAMVILAWLTVFSGLTSFTLGIALFHRPVSPISRIIHGGCCCRAGRRPNGITSVWNGKNTLLGWRQSR